MPQRRRRSNATPPARSAFLEYVNRALGAVTRAGHLSREGAVCEVTAFRLKGRETRGEPFPLITKPTAQSNLLTEHVRALLRLTIPEGSDSVLNRASWRASMEDGAADRGRWKLTPGASDDFIFSYPLPHVAAPPSLPDYVARFLSLLFDVVEPLCGEEVVSPDAFRLDGREVKIPLTPPTEPLELGARQNGDGGTGARQPLQSVATTEPPIVTLALHWALLASFLKVQTDGSSTSLKGLRLRSAKDWVVDSACHPAEVYEYLARVCNVACKFCYLYGNPSGIAVARGTKMIERGELETRMRYFAPREGRAMFRAQWEINEFLVDPKLPDVLRDLRRHSDQPFFFITNGSPLKPDVIELLAEVKPVHVIVSTNTLDAPLRTALMRERESQTRTALSCLERLAEHGIPFGVSLVAYPELPLERLADTIRRLDELRPACVRINQYGYTREHPNKIEVDTDRLWRSVAEWAQTLRGEVSVPLVTIPSAYEENVFHADPNGPRILGAVPGSPAARAGLRAGNLVRRVSFFEVKTRSQLQSLLLLVRGRVEVTFERAGRLRTCVLDAGAGTSFPYPGHVFGKYVFPFGVVSAPSLSAADAAEIERTLGARRRKGRAWVITSPTMLRAGADLLSRFAPDVAERVHFVTARNHFLGGNIRVMDMCTVGDIARAIAEELKSLPPPRLIFLPGTGLNEHGRDLAGRHWSDLERWFGIPVRLLNATAQFLF